MRLFNFIVFKVEDFKGLCIGKVTSVDEEKSECAVHFYGTYPKSSLIEDRTYFPS